MFTIIDSRWVRDGDYLGPRLSYEMSYYVLSVRSQRLTFDDISKICTDFYQNDEILAAKISAEQILHCCLPNLKDPTNVVPLWKTLSNAVLILT